MKNISLGNVLRYAETCKIIYSILSKAKIDIWPCEYNNISLTISKKDYDRIIKLLEYRNDI